MRRIGTVLAVLAITAAGCSLAAAATVTVGPYTVPAQAGTFSANVNVQQFNQSLGTLTGIHISSTANFVVNFTIQNPAGNGPAVYSGANGAGAVDVTGPAGLDIFLTGNTPNQAGNLADGQSITYNSQPASDTETADPTDFGDFSGDGTHTVQLTFTSDGFGATGACCTANLQYSANGTSGGSVTVTYTYTPPDLTISKTHAAGTFAPGSTVTYTITPNNISSASSAGTVTVTETGFPAQLTATSISGAGWTCTQPKGPCTSNAVIPGNGSGTPITLVATVNAGVAPNTTITNTVTVGGGNEVNLANDTATDSLTTPIPDLTISKTHAGTFFPGSAVTFTITANNIAPAAPSFGMVTVTETGFPAQLTATSISGAGWTCTQPQGPCTSNAVIAASGSGTPLTLVATVNAGVTPGTTITNTVTVGGGGETNLANDTATDSLITAIPDLTISKTHAAGTFVPGSTVTFTITPNNIAAAPSTGTVSVTETGFPAQLTAASIGGAGWTCTQPQGPCTSNAVIPGNGSGTSLTLVATVNAGVTPGTTITNTVTVGGGGETNLANDTATDSLTTQVPDLTISKTHAAGTFNPGSTVTYTITPHNIATAASTSGSITMTETPFPAQLTATSISGAGWACTQPQGPCTTNAVIGPAGSGNPITLVATINAGVAAATTITNNVTIGGDRRRTLPTIPLPMR